MITDLQRKPCWSMCKMSQQKGRDWQRHADKRALWPRRHQEKSLWSDLPDWAPVRPGWTFCCVTLIWASLNRFLFLSTKKEPWLGLCSCSFTTHYIDILKSASWISMFRKRQYFQFNSMYIYSDVYVCTCICVCMCTYTHMWNLHAYSVIKLSLPFSTHIFSVYIFVCVPECLFKFNLKAFGL